MVHNYFVGSRSLCDEGMLVVIYAEKIEHGNHQFKELVLCLMALVKDRSTDQECGNEEEWVKLGDRGGLWYIFKRNYIFIVHFN